MSEDVVINFTIPKDRIISIRKARKILKKYFLTCNYGIKDTRMIINKIISNHCIMSNNYNIKDYITLFHPACLSVYHSSYIVAYYPEKIRKLIK